MLVAERRLDRLREDSEYAYRTYRWIAADRERFQQVAMSFLYLNFKGVRIQQGTTHVELTLHGYRLTDNDIFRNDRNLYPTLTRYLLAMHPELKSSVRISKSAIDKISLPPLPQGWALIGAINTDRELTAEDWY